jgi:hypothetical protein
MLDLKCDKCGQPLQQPGALAFGPPQGDGWLVEKYHLCVDCWSVIVAELKGSPPSTPGRSSAKP